MFDTRWFSIEATGCQWFQLGLVEFCTVPDIPCSRDHGSHAIVRMRVGLDLYVRGNCQLDRVDPSFSGVSLERSRLNPVCSGRAGTGICTYKGFYLRGGKANFTTLSKG